MTDHRITISDDSVMQDENGLPEKKSYTVASKAGLFKNGKQYKQGDQIELDEQTAKNFIASGDIEDGDAK